MMKSSIRAAAVVILVLAASLPSLAQSKHPMTFEDLMKVHRIDDPQVSPDGRWVVFTVGDANLEANKVVSHLWLTPLAGGEPRQITGGSGSDTRPRWAPDGHEIAFISTRGGTSQVWLLPLEGGE